VELDEGVIVKKTTEEVAAAVLQAFLQKARSFLKVIEGAPGLTVLPVPLWFKDCQRAALLEAAKLANLGTVATIEEPIAAAKAYGLDKQNL